MTKAAKAEIYQIMGSAFDRAAAVLLLEAQKLLRAQPSRYSRFVLAVGWGPTLFDTAGHIVHEAPTKRGQQFLELADDFYDRFGADNSDVTADD